MEGTIASKRRRLKEIDDATARKRQQGQMADAVRLMERGLELRMDVFGVESPQVLASCKDLADALNGVALKHLQQEELEAAFKLLRKAEVLTTEEDLLTAVTFNNLACYYRRKGRLRISLQYLERALQIESTAEVVVNPAGTRLNLCAVLSQLGKHPEALQHAQQAVILLQEELVSQAAAQDLAMSLDASPELLNKMAVLAISYHNMGVEYEHLRNPAAAAEAHGKGVDIARYYLGDSNDITKTLQKSLEAVSAQKEQQANQKQRPPSALGKAYDKLQTLRSANSSNVSGMRPSSRATSAGRSRSRPVSALSASKSKASSAYRAPSAKPRRATSATPGSRARPVSAAAVLSGRSPNGSLGSGTKPLPAWMKRQMGDSNAASSAAQGLAAAVDMSGQRGLRARPASALPAFGNSSFQAQSTSGNKSLANEGPLAQLAQLQHGRGVSPALKSAAKRTAGKIGPRTPRADSGEVGFSRPPRPVSALETSSSDQQQASSLASTGRPLSGIPQKSRPLSAIPHGSSTGSGSRPLSAVSRPAGSAQSRRSAGSSGSNGGAMAGSRVDLDGIPDFDDAEDDFVQDAEEEAEDDDAWELMPGSGGQYQGQQASAATRPFSGKSADWRQGRAATGTDLGSIGVNRQLNGSSDSAKYVLGGDF